jgi:hypothetical protein
MIISTRSSSPELIAELAADLVASHVAGHIASSATDQALYESMPRLICEVEYSDAARLITNEVVDSSPGLLSSPSSLLSPPGLPDGPIIDIRDARSIRAQAWSDDDLDEDEIPPVVTYTIKKIEAMAKANGHHVNIMKMTRSMDTERISSMQPVMVTCDRGHTWTSKVAFIKAKCAICDLIYNVRNYDITVLAKTYVELNSADLKSLLCKCGKGHQFQVKSTWSTDCPVCQTYRLAMRKSLCSRDELSLADGSTSFHENSAIQFHCTKWKHMRACRDCAKFGQVQIDCTNYVRCNRKFYASFDIINKTDGIFNCETNHGWSHNTHLDYIFRIFEALYGRTFIDNGPHAMSAYCAALGIAAIHSRDPLIKTRLVQTWATAAKVKLVVIPTDVVLLKDLAKFIIRALQAQGEVPGALGAMLSDVFAHMRKKYVPDVEEHFVY